MNPSRRMSKDVFLYFIGAPVYRKHVDGGELR